MANTGSPRRSALYQILQPSTGKGNTIIVWNTVYRTAVVEQLKQKGYPTCIPHIVVRVCVAAIVKTYHLATLAL